MKIIKPIISLAFIIGLNYMCQWFVKTAHINFPAPLIAMILLSILMYFKIIPLEFIEKGANILLENIGLFFVSLIVGAFVYLPVIKKELFTVFAIFIFSSVFLIILTGLTTQYFLSKRVCKDKMEQDND
jgi:holin-like protein